MAPKRKAQSDDTSQPRKRPGAKKSNGNGDGGGGSDPETSGQASDESESDFELNKEEQEYFKEQDELVNGLIQKLSVDNFTLNQRPENERDPASQYFPETDLSAIALLPDHPTRPIWVAPTDGRVILESFSPLFKKAERFLISVAEPRSRVSLVHEYSITSHSLIAASAAGLSGDNIIDQLGDFCKTALPDSTKDFILASTKSFGQVRLVLRDRKYMIETSDLSVLQRLLQDPLIGPLRVNPDEDVTKASVQKVNALTIPGTKTAAEVKQVVENSNKLVENGDGPNPNETSEDAKLAAYMDDDEEEARIVYSFEVAPASVQDVSRRCQAIGLPLTEEYDFRNDHVNADLEIDLNPATLIRPYQETALQMMFSEGRAKSGIIVLPCGAGKTLVGITAACTIRKGVIVLCTSAMSVGQWRNEFLKWSNIHPKDVAVFTSDHKDVFPGNTGIIITTYSMVTQTRTRSHEAQQVMDFLAGREWGLMLLDEVHVVPADIFKRVTYQINAHTKLGLTATLLREDNRIGELNFLIGPKLYEANWKELSEQGHIARVQCSEVWCQMSPEFYLEYIRTNQAHERNLLFAMNPCKFQACQFLINYHEQRGDKIIVFSDNVFALKWYARKLKKFYIYGDTSNSERVTILENFQHNPAVNTLFLSKIGDTSLDLPEATCLIQISSHYGSRRQEAQRLGRILRAKRRNDEGFNAFFYSLVSKGTDEMFYSAKRQAFLVNQGYAFKVITHFDGIENTPDLGLTTARERREILALVMKQKASYGRIESIKGDLFSSNMDGRKNYRSAGLLGDLSGGQDMAYAEFDKHKRAPKAPERSAAFTKLHREHQKRKEQADADAAEEYPKGGKWRK